MEDTQAPPLGTLGEVQGVDDAGKILVHWQTGSSLNLIPDVDTFRIVLGGKAWSRCKTPQVYTHIRLLSSSLWGIYTHERQTIATKKARNRKWRKQKRDGRRRKALRHDARNGIHHARGAETWCAVHSLPWGSCQSLWEIRFWRGDFGRGIRLQRPRAGESAAGIPFLPLVKYTVWIACYIPESTGICDYRKGKPQSKRGGIHHVEQRKEKSLHKTIDNIF